VLIRELLPELDDEQFRRLETYVSSTSLLERLGTASNTPDSESIVRLSAPVLKALGPTAEPSMFHALIAQLAEGERDNVERAVAASGYAAPSRLPLLVSQFVENLTARLTNFYLRPLVAHIKKISSQGLLQGDTPEERYEDYCRRWGEEFSDDFYASYPLLPGVHGRTIEQFHAMIAEIFERVSAREDDIRELLNVKNDSSPLGLESISLAGDPHNGGRVGCLFVFCQGKVAYKPRSVEGEWVFWKIVQDLAAQGAPSMRAARVIRGDGYGFMEFIKREDADFYAEDFLGACGRLAALLYALQAKDLHMENVIPLKEGPVPIDLETTLHPIRVLMGNDSGIPEDSAFFHAIRGVSTSGLLPTRLTRGGSAQGYLDVGFIQGEQGDNPFKGMTVERPFRDDAVIRFEQSYVSKNSNESGDLSSDADTNQDAQASRADAFARGFTQMYRWICEHRDTVLNLVRNAYTGLTLRCVLKPTMHYGQLIRMLGSSEALASKQVFATVALRTAVFDQDSPLELIAEEAEALWEFDVPFFTHRTDCSGITSFSGHDVGLKVKNSALEETLEHITNMGEDDLDNQLNQIWSAFISLYPNDTLISKSTAELWQGRSQDGGEDSLNIKIANQLLQRIHPGITNNDSWTWVAPTPGTRQHTGVWDTVILEPDLYAGSVGIALALAQVACVLGNEQYAQAAYRVFTPIAKSIVSNKDLNVRDESRDGAFFGEPSIAFALAGAAEYLNDSRLKDAAVVSGNRVAGRLAQAEHPTPDYLTGQVGAAALLLGHDLASDREALLGVLDWHAQDIIAGRVDDEWWIYSGFAHGISASIFALSRWNQQMTSPKRAQQAVQILLDRLREFDNGESWISQIPEQGSRGGVWCHGTAGISLALAAVQAWMPELSTRADLERAVHHALHEGTGRNLTYCHGDLGTLDILEWVVNHVPDLPDAEKIRDVLDNGYSASLLQKTLEDKSARNSLTPSYMVGTSGVLSWLTRRIGGTQLYTPIIPDSTEE